MMKKTALVLPVFAALALTSGNHAADAFDVVVSATVSKSCSIASAVPTIAMPTITDANGRLDNTKDLAMTQVATVTCNGPTKVEVTGEKGYFRHNTDTGSCPSNGSATCLQYDAVVNLGSQTTMPVNANGRTQSFNTAGAVSAGALRLAMDLTGPSSDPLVAGIYSEKFIITVSPL
jgi:hypothetical protein